jgi:hypothetical protein
MTWAGNQHPVETLVEWLAPIPLASAAGWASWRLGVSPVVAVTACVAVLAAGFAAMKLGGSARPAPAHRFAPAEFAPVELDELVLEEKDSILELNDRLDEILPDSRVVRLFERQDPTPGELVDRIVDFLADGRPSSTAGRPTADARPVPDASAALHDALANIRASLR